MGPVDRLVATVRPATVFQFPCSSSDILPLLSRLYGLLPSVDALFSDASSKPISHPFLRKLPRF
jgi:hypothetical protein